MTESSTSPNDSSNDAIPLHAASHPEPALEATSDDGPFENPYAAPNQVEEDEFPDPVDEGGFRQNWILAIVESFGWFAGTLAAQIGCGIFVGAVIVAYAFATTGRFRPDDLKEYMSPLMIGGESLFVLVTMLAISIRYWGRTGRTLNFSPPDSRHVLLVVGATLPLAFWISQWSEPIQMCWKVLMEMYPVLRFLDEMNSMTVVREIADTTILPLLILGVAVMPAIGEEIVFRGAIGRVLIAHFGIWGGVLATSFLFGWCHIHPVHALSVMPVGIALHFVYLATRSFWIPVLLHFANNCWASVLLKYRVEEPVINGLNTKLLDGIELATAAVAVIAAAIALRQSRVRYLQEDGCEWKSPQFPTEVPTSPGIRRTTGPVSLLIWGLAICSMVVCHVALGVNYLNNAQPVEEPPAIPASIS